MRILIDGFNLIHASHDFAQAHANGGGQEALLAALKIYRQRKGHQVTVVFDGGPDMQPTRSTRHQIPVIHSGGGQSADDVIAGMAAKNGAALTVVTDDRELQARCQGAGAQVVGSGEFAFVLLETAFGPGAADDDDEGGWDFNTKKKGPSRRLPKAKRRKKRMRSKL